MENPYQSPVESPESPGDWPIGPQRSRGLVRHVRIVAVLMVIQGILEALIGICVGVAAAFIPWHTGNEASLGPLWVFGLVYGGVALIVLAVAGLHIAAGLQNFRFRGRALGMAALGMGLLTVATCYCLPTAACLCVYGLIVFLNQEVCEAFALGERGNEPREILAAFRFAGNAVPESPFALPGNKAEKHTTKDAEP